jgi:hypothetical protein
VAFVDAGVLWMIAWLVGDCLCLLIIRFSKEKKNRNLFRQPVQKRCLVPQIVRQSNHLHRYNEILPKQTNNKQVRGT